ncbi:MAG TPA: GDSL-type esterase/lipase family protein [Phycisphaerae bacterium]|nr:hypothetical protein [Phycisphaerales bacterium]HRX83962.1 GDSL-type esterase/lipase family protein [Phycisphaerae bacterium]
MKTAGWVRAVLATAPWALLLGVAGCGDLRVPDPNVVYIAFGDSATKGPADDDYPDLLRARLGVAANTFANEGEGGDTIAEGVDRLASLLDSGIYPNAEVLLLWEGGGDLIDFIGEIDPFLLWSVNDSDYPYQDELDAKLDEIGANLADAIARGRAAGLDVYTATYFPILGGFSACPGLPFDFIIPGQAERANEYLALLNAEIRRRVSASGATLVDIGRDAANLADDRGNYENCNHLSSDGNARVAELFYDALR